MLTDGLMFDGSSIAGWKAINESDMILSPDISTAVMDPFCADPMMIIFCDITEPSTGQFYSRDPRSTAKKAEAWVKSSGVGDTVFFGPEAEFFVFDDVRFKVDMNHCFYEVDSIEGPYVTGKTFETGNYAHRPAIKGGYFPVPPIDSAHDMRAEMVQVLSHALPPVDLEGRQAAVRRHRLCGSVRDGAVLHRRHHQARQGA